MNGALLVWLLIVGSCIAAFLIDTFFSDDGSD